MKKKKKIDIFDYLNIQDPKIGSYDVCLKNSLSVRLKKLIDLVDRDLVEVLLVFYEGDRDLVEVVLVFYEGDRDLVEVILVFYEGDRNLVEVILVFYEGDRDLV